MLFGDLPQPATGAGRPSTFSPQLSPGAQPKAVLFGDVPQKSAPAPTPSQATPPPAGENNLFGNTPAGKVANLVTGSEQTFGKALSTAIPSNPITGKNAPDTAAEINSSADASKGLLLQAIHAQTDPVKAQHMLDAYQKIWGNVGPVSAGDINPGFNLTPREVAGAAAGTALDTLSAGSYGKAAEGAETGKLLVKGGGAVEDLAGKVGIPTTEKAVAPLAETAARPALGQALKDIGTKTAARTAVGAATGYGYDVSQNLQAGANGPAALKPGMGTVLGGSVPLGIGALEAGAAVTRDIAPRFINSLIKPNAASFSYGKDPGRTVATMGITGNNLADFANNISKAKDDVGSKIGDIYSNPANADARINATPTLEKLDSAIGAAAKGGKNNQGIVTALQNVKDALLYDHTVDGEGNIVKAGTTPKDLSNLTPQQAFDLKQAISDKTQFTGRPSDDKTVNAVLKSMYGDLKGKLNASVSTNNPEITTLNQRYADLTSAALATKNRDAIVQRSNMVSLKSGGAGAIATGAAILGGAATIPAALAGVTAAALEQAMETTAVKSRVAAWLGSESPSVVTKVLQQNPAIKTVLYRALPKFASQLR